jgi:hypothetical protein
MAENLCHKTIESLQLPEGNFIFDSRHENQLAPQKLTTSLQKKFRAKRIVILSRPKDGEGSQRQPHRPRSTIRTSAPSSDPPASHAAPEHNTPSAQRS